MKAFPPTTRSRVSIVLTVIAASAAVCAAPRALHGQAPRTATAPSPLGAVNDVANVIADSVRTRLRGDLSRLKARNGGEIMVVTLPDLGDEQVEDVTQRLVSSPREGAPVSSRFKGTLLLVIPKESSRDGKGYCRIGLGSEASAIISSTGATSICGAGIPAFKLRNYGTGVALIVDELVRQYDGNAGKKH